MSRPANLAVPIFFCALAALSGPASSLAQSTDSGTVLQAYRIPDGQSVDLDGRITEEVWSQAIPIRDFTQREPVEGGAPSRETEIWVAYDSDKLYIGAIMYDDPDGILAHQKQRDGFLSTDDRFMWILDTFKDGRTGYFFETNPAGVLSDALITGGGGGGGGFGGGGGSGRAWDGIWDVRTFVRPDGWSLEVEIPFRTLNFDPSSSEWGINFQRTIRRENEEIMWRAWRRTESLQRPVFAGTLTGLEGMSQGIGLEAVPSAITGFRNIPTNTDPTTYPRDMSLDLNYSITSSLRASLSLNTDFAEVESDDRRVNLTRFSLRFPERRGFFLEGSGIFSFAPRSGPEPFFSRNIGISSGQQVPINYGTRVTGQVGRTEIGFFQVGTGASSYFSESAAEDVFLPSEQFSVARVRQPLWEQSTIGAIYTRRSTAQDESGYAPETGHTAGVDLELNTRTFLGKYNAEMEAFFVWNSNPDPNQDRSVGDLSARGIRFNFPNDRWTGHLSYREFGDDYRPTLGFVARNDFRRIEPRIGFSPRPDIDFIRKLDFAVQFRNLTELGTGVLEEREWEFNVLGIDFESGDNIDFNVKRVYEYLDSDFEISDGIEIRQGEYTNWEYSIRANTAGRRKISLFGGGGWSGFWNGDRKSVFARATLRPNPGISTSLNVQYNDVQLPQGNFGANVYELETQWNPTPWVSATSQFQYDDQSQLLGLFAKLRWIVKPGNDIYLVYTHNWQNLGAGILDNPDLITLSRGGSIKLNYTYRF